MDNIKITIETNANEAAKTFENLANSFNDADTQAQDLRKEIKSLKNEIYKLEPGTKEYTQTLVKLGEKMNTLGDINRDVRSSTGGLDTVFQTTTKTISSMAAGMQACMGVVTLFGGDTEDLQKQFVKLQAAMSIVQGLSGFSGLTKAAGDAASAIRAFIVRITLSTTATEADTAAKTKNTAATLANSAAQVKNAGSMATTTVATGTATKAVSKLGTAFAGLGGYILAAVAVIAVVWKALDSLEEKTNDNYETWKNYEAIMYDTGYTTEQAAQSFEDMDKALEDQLSSLKEHGATQEQLNKVKREYYEQQLKSIKAQAEETLAERDKIKWYNILWKSTEKNRKKMEELNAEYRKYRALLEETNKINPYDELQKGLDQYTKQIELRIAEGLADAEDKYNGWIKLTRSKIDGMKKGAARRHRELTDEELLDIQRMEKDIADWEYQIELLHASARKKMADETKKTMADYKKNFESLSHAISTALKETEENLETDFNRIAGTDVEGKTVLSNLFIKFRELTLKGVDPKLIEQYKQDIEDALNNKQITDAQADALNKMVDNIKNNYNELLNKLINSFSGDDLNFDTAGGIKLNVDKFVEIMSQANDVIDLEITNVTDFRKRVADLKTAFDNGEIDPGQYAEAIHRNITDYYNTLNQAMHDIPKYVNELMQSDVFDGMDIEQKDLWKKVLTKYLEQAFYIPDSELTALTEAASKQIFTQLDTVFKDLENQMAAAQQAAEQRFYASSNNIMNKGGEGFQGFMNKLISGEFWGTGEGQSYQLAKQQTEDMWNAYKETADKEIAEIDRLMASAGEDMTLREELNNRKLDLQAKYNLAMEQYYNDLENLEHEHLAGIVSNINSVVNATGSLGSALSDYYSEMANDERLSEKEQREYTLKSLKMKKAMAYVSIAQGIVSAIAGAMELGFPMGPIVAALESASVAVAGAVQIKQINKQIRELNGSAGSDTPDAAGMVDRIITANAQNTDQTAQLNAEYTGGAVGEQKVYVTQSDISDAQDLNRTAVTQNGF